ncbi:unnamed protein product [Caenorhabditis angaria]|uniref:Uncharacterized protein n=1 Tax=Caenorhabditis angaria TaxID=860376 RepID=A0A9P1IZX4_9PELO|nr:unnamed protein product [Caenorhabditis angaria]
MTMTEVKHCFLDDDEHECCIDMLHETKKDNTLPLITMTPQMPATIKTQDRPVVLYMAPVAKQASNCICPKPDEDLSSGVRNVHI